MHQNKIVPFPKALADAGFDTQDLTFVPRGAVHDFMVNCDAWLDVGDGLLMFVGATGPQVSRFMYYIGEERNQDVEGIGPGIAAYRIDEERVDWIRNRLPRE